MAPRRRPSRSSTTSSSMSELDGSSEESVEEPCQLPALYKAIEKGKDIPVAVRRWLHTYARDEDRGLYELIHTVFCAAGSQRLTREDFEDQELQQLVNSFRASTLPGRNNEYPIVWPGAKGKHFAADLTSLMEHLVKNVCSCLDDGKALLPELVKVINLMARSQRRAFRHTGTFMGLKLATALMMNVKQLESASDEEESDEEASIDEEDREEMIAICERYIRRLLRVCFKIRSTYSGKVTLDKRECLEVGGLVFSKDRGIAKKAGHFLMWYIRKKPESLGCESPDDCVSYKEFWTTMVSYYLTTYKSRLDASVIEQPESLMIDAMLDHDVTLFEQWMLTATILDEDLILNTDEAKSVLVRCIAAAMQKVLAVPTPTTEQAIQDHQVKVVQISKVYVRALHPLLLKYPNGIMTPLLAVLGEHMDFTLYSEEDLRKASLWRVLRQSVFDNCTNTELLKHCSVIVMKLECDGTHSSIDASKELVEALANKLYGAYQAWNQAYIKKEQMCPEHHRKLSEVLTAFATLGEVKEMCKRGEELLGLNSCTRQLKIAFHCVDHAMPTIDEKDLQNAIVGSYYQLLWICKRPNNKADYFRKQFRGVMRLILKDSSLSDDLRLTALKVSLDYIRFFHSNIYTVAYDDANIDELLKAAGRCILQCILVVAGHVGRNASALQTKAMRHCLTSYLELIEQCPGDSCGASVYFVHYNQLDSDYQQVIREIFLLFWKRNPQLCSSFVVKGLRQVFCDYCIEENYMDAPRLARLKGTAATISGWITKHRNVEAARYLTDNIEMEILGLRNENNPELLPFFGVLEKLVTAIPPKYHSSLDSTLTNSFNVTESVDISTFHRTLNSSELSRRRRRRSQTQQRPRGVPAASSTLQEFSSPSGSPRHLARAPALSSPSPGLSRSLCTDVRSTSAIVQLPRGVPAASSPLRDFSSPSGSPRHSTRAPVFSQIVGSELSKTPPQSTVDVSRDISSPSPGPRRSLCTDVRSTSAIVQRPRGVPAASSTLQELSSTRVGPDLEYFVSPGPGMPLCTDVRSTSASHQNTVECVPHVAAGPSGMQRSGLSPMDSDPRAEPKLSCRPPSQSRCAHNRPVPSHDVARYRYSSPTPSDCDDFSANNTDDQSLLDRMQSSAHPPSASGSIPELQLGDDSSSQSSLANNRKLPSRAVARRRYAFRISPRGTGASKTSLTQSMSSLPTRWARSGSVASQCGSIPEEPENKTP